MAACSSLFHATIGRPLGLDLSFAQVRAEFDRSVSRSDPQKKPESPDVAARQQLPGYLRQLRGREFDFLLTNSANVGPGPMAGGNAPGYPPGYARERLVILNDMVDGDPERAAEVAARALWLLEKDRNILNRVVALRAVETIIHDLGLDPMDPHLDTIDDSIARRQQVEAAEAEMEKLWPGLRRQKQLDDDARTAFAAALDQMLASPLPTARSRRALVLAMAAGHADETDPMMHDKLAVALRRSLLFVTGLGLRDSLSARQPEVRDVAIRAYRRLCGAIGVPYVLRRIVAPAGSGRGNRYDPDPSVRLTLVRLCAQMRGEAATQSVRRGRMPVDFLYDTLVADDDAGLRQAALEGLALCLQRPVSFDEEWPTTWRQKFIVERSPR